jgi:hypothetical protein
MSNGLNSKVFTWALGVIQPARPEEVQDYIQKMFSYDDELHSKINLKSTISNALQEGVIRCVSKKSNLYILTSDGDSSLGIKLRVLKDKNRLYLLKSMRGVTFRDKGVSDRNMSGVSPLESLRLSTKVSPRTEFPLSSGPQPQSHRKLWPRAYNEQLRIGSKSETPFHSVNLNYYSSNTIPNIETKQQATIALSELIGISNELLNDFCTYTDRYYRKFEIPKKSGNETRVICAPRTFIKTTQHWILDYFLYRLNQHNSCFSFKQKTSIKDNASVHLNRKFILCLDIKSFFDNITIEQVRRCLEKGNINSYLAALFADIVTLNGSLPQGAPTSPTISNSHLYEFDGKMLEYCSDNEMTYSRYADDLTIGSDNYDALKKVEKLVQFELNKLDLNLNHKKTRIISSNNCQVVTGIAINNGEIRPTRKYRKEIRALFYKAEVDSDVVQLPKLLGHFNYLKSFINGDTSHNLNKYQIIINKLIQKKKIQNF